MFIKSKTKQKQKNGGWGVGGGAHTHTNAHMVKIIAVISIARYLTDMGEYIALYKSPNIYT